MIKLKISFNFSMAYLCYKFCQKFILKTNFCKFDVAHHGWAMEKGFHFWEGKSAISSYIFNVFGGKFKENYWKLGQIGQNT